MTHKNSEHTHTHQNPHRCPEAVTVHKIFFCDDVKKKKKDGLDATNGKWLKGKKDTGSSYEEEKKLNMHKKVL